MSVSQLSFVTIVKTLGSSVLSWTYNPGIWLYVEKDDNFFFLDSNNLR